jgi:hypothetical protein
VTRTSSRRGAPRASLCNVCRSQAAASRRSRESDAAGARRSGLAIVTSTRWPGGQRGRQRRHARGREIRAPSDQRSQGPGTRRSTSTTSTRTSPRYRSSGVTRSNIGRAVSQPLHHAHATSVSHPCMMCRVSLQVRDLRREGHRQA